MDIVSRARGIVLRPKAEWPVIDAERATLGTLYANYLIPLGLVGMIARFIGMSLIGVSVPFLGRIRLSIMSGLTSAIVGFVFLLVGMYVWAMIINALAPTFGGRKDMISALKLAVYSATPMLVAAVLSVLPLLGFVQLIAGIYALYVLYVGFPVLMKVAPDRAAGYTAATVVSGIVLGLIVGAVTSTLGLGVAGGLGTSRVTSDATAEQAGQNIVAGMLGAAGGGTSESKNAAAALVAGAVAAGQAAERAERTGAATPTLTGNGTTDDAATAAASAGAAAAMLGSMVSGGKPAVELVPFQTLKEALPGSVGPLQRTNASGEKSSVAGISGSSAEGEYSAGDGRVTVKISDMGNAAGVMALGRMAFTVESESDRGFEKNVTLNGQKVHEKWTTSGQSSELAAFVGDRFMIEVHGSGVDVGTAEKAFASIDLGKLRAQ